MRANLKHFVIGFWCLVLLGCSGPAVRVEHRFDNAVVLPEGVRGMQVGKFSVEGYSQETAERFVRDSLSENLRKAGYGEPGSALSVAAVEGALRIDVKDTEGVGKVREGNPSVAMGERELPSLTRRVTVNSVFTLKGEGESAPVEVELERKYDSTGDPRTRGELGLKRGDDPANATATETIVKELIGECAEDFCGMLAPLTVKTGYVLRGSWNEDAQRGAKAAKKKNYAAAGEYYMSALEGNAKDGDLWFNLGVVTEAQGDFANAYQYFERARALSGDKDAEAREASDLARKLMGKRLLRLPSAG